MKKVWQITRSMGEWPINLQVKKNVVQKIRPGVWYTERGRIMFESMEDFVSAIDQTVWQNPATRKDSGTWLARFKKYYEAFYGVKLTIPRSKNSILKKKDAVKRFVISDDDMIRRLYGLK